MLVKVLYIEGGVYISRSPQFVRMLSFA